MARRKLQNTSVEEDLCYNKWLFLSVSLCVRIHFNIVILNIELSLIFFNMYKYMIFWAVVPV